jgi:hypothetical protein
MKKIFLVSLSILAFTSTQGQVTVCGTPVIGYEQRIINYIDNMSVVDTHEHLVSPTGIKNGGMFDFMLLFNHYTKDDIRSAGMSTKTFQSLVKDSLTVMQKWDIVSPSLDKTFNTAYYRAALLTAGKLFGVKEINRETVSVLTERIKEAYQQDWYKIVLEEKCKIDFLILDGTDRSFGNPQRMRYTWNFDYHRIDSRKKVDEIAIKTGLNIASLPDLVNAMDVEFQNGLKAGFVTIKTPVAYHRSLYFEDVSKEEAQAVFDKLPNNTGQSLTSDEVKKLSDYMMHRLLDLAKKYNKPIQFHTGLQAGDGNNIENSNPALLTNLFLKYREVQFILFHGGYPFGGEFGTVAKNFRNVYLDLCWLYIISPSYSERYLHEWLETVPVSKIMAFGGDYQNVENIYAHLLFAKEIISRVLIEKVKSGYFTEKEALKVAQMILHDNAVNLFHLK